MMTVKIEKGKMILTIDMLPKPSPSKSGKNLLVATTHGNMTTEAMIDGKPVVVSVNAYVRKD